MRRATTLLVRVLILLLAGFELFLWGNHLPLLLLPPVSALFTGSRGWLPLVNLVVFPACAVSGAVLAIMGRRLGWAAALVAFQPVVFVVTVVILMLMGFEGNALRLAPSQ
jgi:hypothetical protein